MPINEAQDEIVEEFELFGDDPDMRNSYIIDLGRKLAPMPPEFHAEVRKTYSLLTSIAVLSGVLMAAAVLLGLFLGFGRATVRVWLGKPAATEGEFLNLGLPRGPSKPLS